LSQGLYRIDKILGGGAHALICLVHDVSGGRTEPVVLKVARTEHLNNVGILDRMRDEGRILSRLRYPNILRVYRVLDYNGRPVIEMEFVAGISLDRLFQRPDETFPVGVALKIVRDVAKALDVAYNGSFDVDGQPMNIIHRDVKPENIVLDIAGQVKVVDFGVAKGDFANREAKSLYLAPGSQGFVPPERFEGRKDSPGVDVYALGVTLFKLLTGKSIVASSLREKHDEDVKRQVAYLNAPGLDDVEELRKLISKMVARNVGRRPGMSAVVETLEQFIGGLDHPVDIAKFATEVVGPIIEAAEHVAAREHPSYADLVFLERELPSDEGRPLTLEEANIEVERFLSTDGWEERIPELQRILKRCSAPVQSPFYKLLDRAKHKWWKPWQRPASPKQVTGVLVVLCDYPCPKTTRYARALVDSEHVGIATAAKFLLKIAGE
jgi:serine/threonine protein kinase